MSNSYLFVAESSNTKTGPIPVTISPRKTCPSICPLKASGCYAENFPLSLHWSRVDNGAGMSWGDMCAQIAALPDGQLWRGNVAGDLPHHRGRIDERKLSVLVDANSNRRGFTYSHHAVLGGKDHIKNNRRVINRANNLGFTINLSANNPTHADKLADLNIAPVVVLLPENAPRHSWSPAGRLITLCPATYRDDVTCATCSLCQRAGRSVIVGFPAHGAAKRKAQEIALSSIA